MSSSVGATVGPRTLRLDGEAGITRVAFSGERDRGIRRWRTGSPNQGEGAYQNEPESEA